MNIIKDLQTKLDVLWKLVNNKKVFKNESLYNKAWNIYKNEKVTIEELDSIINELNLFIR